MGAPEFSELVGHLVESMGQQVTAIRHTDQGLTLQTGDGFLYAFLEDPNQVSLEQVQSLGRLVGDAPMKLVLLTPGHLPLALLSDVLAHHGTVVDGARFAELVRGLGFGEYLGEEPRVVPTPPQGRLLPSAHQLDEVMRRARTWLEWGVPALSLRFYRQAAAMKPEFAPALVGVGRSLLALGLAEDADRIFAEVLAQHPEDLDAQVGRAGVLGALGKSADEVAAYRALLTREGRVEIRAHLVAALIAEKHWEEARREIEEMLRAAPEDPQFRFLHAASLWKTGANEEGDRERDRARSLGLPFERESALSEHLGLPRPKAPAEPPAAARPRRAKPSPRAARTAPRPRSPPASGKPRKAKGKRRG